MSPIQHEIDTFSSLRAGLERDHMGEWVLIFSGNVINFFASFERAADEAVERFGSGPFLIRQIGAEPLTLPASVMYRPDAGR